MTERTEEEWERWEADQPGPRDDPDEEPVEPWATDDDEEREREGRWRR